MTIPPYGELNVIRAMIDYIEPKSQTRHADLLLDELSDRVANAPRSTLILKALLGKPAHIPLRILQSYLDAVGDDLLGELSSMDEDTLSPFAFIDFDQVPCEEQVPLFDLCAKWHTDKLRLSRPNDIIKAAVLSGNAGLMDRLQAFLDLSDYDLMERVEQSAALEEASSNAAPFIESLLKKVDLESDNWSSIGYEILRKRRARSLALYMAVGWNPKNAILQYVEPKQSGSWLERLAYRLTSSHHAALKILKEAPSVREILSLDILEIPSFLGGPDKDHQTRQKKLDQMTHAIQLFNQRGQDIPEGLARAHHNLAKKMQSQN